MKKAILVFALLVLGSSAFAETKTLLFCKNIDQGDIKTLEIEQDENSDETGSITLVEHRKDGTSKTKKVRLKDFKDAYVPLINEDTILIRKRGTDWAILGFAGDYKYFAHAECVE